MIAIIKTGGKQYLVKKDTVLKIEKIDQEVGSSIELPVLLKVADETNQEVELGNPELAQKIKATIVSHSRTKKIPVVKYKRKVHYRRNRSHRQHQTTIKID